MPKSLQFHQQLNIHKKVLLKIKIKQQVSHYSKGSFLFSLKIKNKNKIIPKKNKIQLVQRNYPQDRTKNKSQRTYPKEKKRVNKAVNPRNSFYHPTLKT